VRACVRCSRVVSSCGAVHTLAESYQSRDSSARSGTLGTREYRAGLCGIRYQAKETAVPACRARRCQDGVLLRCNRADSGRRRKPSQIAGRHRKQSWDLTRRDCRTSRRGFSIKLTSTRRKVLRIAFRILRSRRAYHHAPERNSPFLAVPRRHRGTIERTRSGDEIDEVSRGTAPIEDE